MVYLVNGSVNLHKSNVCGQDFVRYLHDLSVSYRLTEYGDIQNMDHYGVIARTVREAQLERVKQAAHERAPKGKKRESMPIHLGLRIMTL